MRARVLATLLLASCHASSPMATTPSPADAAAATAPSPTAAAATPAPPRPAGVADRLGLGLPAWHTVDPAWADAADVILVGRFALEEYGTVIIGTTFETPLGRVLEVERVVRGEVKRRRVNFQVDASPSLASPPLREGRRLALYLHPSAASRARLAEDQGAPYTLDTELGPTEIVAVVDLDQTEAEAAAHWSEVATWRRREALAFAPAAWAEVRRAARVPAERLGDWHHILRQRLLPSWQTRADVRAALGAPDEVAGADEIYAINAAERAAPSAGAVIATVRLHYAADGRLLGYAEDYLVLDGSRLRPGSYEEKRALGLTWSTVER
jgi:hypothetical protein